MACLDAAAAEQFVCQACAAVRERALERQQSELQGSFEPAADGGDSKAVIVSRLAQWESEERSRAAPAAVARGGAAGGGEHPGRPRAS